MNDSHNSSSAVTIATLKPKERLQCKICMQWLSHQCLKRHVLTHTDEKKHKCDVCSMLFRRKYHLVRHKMVHKGHNMVYNMVHNKENTHKCDVCSKLFRTNHTLLQHKITHTDERKYKCDVCSKLFRTKSALCYHVKTHSDVKMHKCDVCLKKFLSTNNFLIHKMIHSNLKQFELFNHKQTGEKKYKCDVCSKLFSKSSTLVRHKITHTGEKNYKCDVCLKSFGRKYTLQIHKKRYCKIRKNEKKTFQCFECERIFPHKRSMKRHLEVHKKFAFKCDTCNKLFISTVKLNNHYKVHPKGKLLFCNLCLESFTENRELRNHIFIKHIHNNIETDVTIQTYQDHVSFHEVKNECREESIVKSCSVVLKPLYIENNMVYGMMSTKPSTTADDVAPNEVKTELTESSDSKPLNVSIIYNEENVEDDIFQTNSCITNSAFGEVKQENQTIKSENFDDVKPVCDQNLEGVFWNIVGKISYCVDNIKLEISDDINLNM